MFLQKGGLRLVRCSHCSMVYVPSVSEAYVDGTFYEDSGRPFFLSPAKLAGDFSPVRFEREIRLFRSFCRKGRVLDVGCSTGAFLFRLHQCFASDYQVFGTDISGLPLDYAETRGITVIRGNFLTHNFTSCFDAITFWAVLEHVENPKAFVTKAFEVLKPGGVCVVLVPNLGSLAFRCLKQRYRYILPQHINYFTSQTLRKIACPPFVELLTTFMHFNPIVILQDWRGAVNVTDQQRAELLVRTNTLKRAPGLAPVRWVYAACERLLGALGLADNCVLVLRRE